MKSIIKGIVAVSLVAVCLTANVQAKALVPLKVSTTAVSDTGKMDKMSKKKMDKMEKKKMGKKKMSKDTSGKM
ncbi:hypothetical protein SNE25_01655 [Mucilaginibacter sabulilitoris]|uniref:Pentapeptide MXKDX repeat protein n=1 Tax=Mucilaginibacter sabulilitoris TaxID=1173583 RepID=A0ABZ0TM39_9SPHI|nr:hypothetical protein [Mucilaginibacter sabulilitoris]WPU94229.1 hypothetical protein SNE25_01655 [Mucilaginibacter sabulilitoris]